MLRHIGDGTGITICKDADFDTFNYDHTFYAFIWILLSVIAAALYRNVYTSISKVGAHSRACTRVCVCESA